MGVFIVSVKTVMRNSKQHSMPDRHKYFLGWSWKVYAIRAYNILAKSGVPKNYLLY